MKIWAKRALLGCLALMLGVMMVACSSTGQSNVTTTTDTTVTTGSTATTQPSGTETTVLSTESVRTNQQVTKPSTTVTSAEKRPTIANAAHLLNPMSGGADTEAEAMRQTVLNSKDTLKVTGTTYYVSPSGNDNNDGTSKKTAWQTIDGVIINGFLLQPGDAVLFERGYVYRRTDDLVLKSGVTYGAYGTGAKPALYGSAANYALSKWTASGQKNIWKLTLETEEAGIVVFDHGVAAGMPKYYGTHELQKNGDFYHDYENATFYLYLDKGNPAQVYKQIEIGTRANIVSVMKGSKDIVLDNVALLYAGMFAFDAKENVQNIRVTNCEIGWSGGCRFNDGKVGLGNGISFWKNTSDVLVENCWIYQAYDAGITPQGTTEAHAYKNLVFRKNLIEFCNYSIEFFDRTNTSTWDGLVIEDNIMRFAGYGFLKASERPDSQTGVAHLLGWTWNYGSLPGKGVTIRNNILDCSARNMVFWSGKEYTSGLTVSGNSFYQKTNDDGKAIRFAKNGQLYATNQAEFETAVRTFDPNAKIIKWLE